MIYPVIAMFNANLITQNEARDRTGNTPVEGGDKYAFELIPAPTPLAFSADMDVKGIEDEQLPGGYDYAAQRWVLPEEKAAGAWKRVDDTIRKHADQFGPSIDELYDNALAMALGTGSKATKAPNADRINIEALVQQFMRSTGELRAKMLREIIALAVADIGGDLQSVLSFVDQIERAATAEVNDKMKMATRTIKEQVSKAIADNQGKPVNEVAKAITEQVNTIKAGRAQAIAQTTAAAQTTRTQQSTWSGMNEREPDAGKRIYKVWITQRDNKVRPSHEDLDGKVVEPDGMFGSGIEGPGLASKAGDAVNCRCVIRSVRGNQIGRG